MLRATTIEHLQKTYGSQDTVVCFIYCYYKSQSEQTPANLVSSLLRPLTIETKSKDITTTFMEFYKVFDGKGSCPSLGEYSSLLLALIAKLKRVFIIVDALDECSRDARSVFLAELKKLPSSVSLMFTTRPIPDILDSFVDTPRIEVRASDDDVRTYLTKEIELSPSLARWVKADSGLAGEIVEKVIEKSKGM